MAVSKKPAVVVSNHHIIYVPHKSQLQNKQKLGRKPLSLPSSTGNRRDLLYLRLNANK